MADRARFDLYRALAAAGLAVAGSLTAAIGGRHASGRMHEAPPGTHGIGLRVLGPTLRSPVGPGWEMWRERLTRLMIERAMASNQRPAKRGSTARSAEMAAELAGVLARRSAKIERLLLHAHRPVNRRRLRRLGWDGLDTYLYARQMWDRPTEYVPDGANIAPEDVLSPSLGRTVGYTDEAHGGGLPKYNQPPPPGDFYFARRKDLLASVDYISGVRDFNSDSMPPPTSGFEFELRLQEDKSRLAPVERGLV